MFILLLLTTALLQSEKPVQPYRAGETDLLVKKRQVVADKLVAMFKTSEPGSVEELRAVSWLNNLEDDFKATIGLSSKKGETGFVDGYFVEVAQVIDKTNALVSLRDRRGKIDLVWLTHKTPDLADGQKLTIGYATVDGVKEYTSVLNAKKTVPHWVAVSVRLPKLKIPLGVDMTRKPEGEVWHFEIVEPGGVEKRLHAKFLRVRRGIAFFTASNNRLIQVPVKQLKPRYQGWIKDRLKRKR